MRETNSLFKNLDSKLRFSVANWTAIKFCLCRRDYFISSKKADNFTIWQWTMALSTTLWLSCKSYYLIITFVRMAVQNHMQRMCRPRNEKISQIAFGFVMTQPQTNLSKFSVKQFKNSEKKTKQFLNSQVRTACFGSSFICSSITHKDWRIDVVWSKEEKKGNAKIINNFQFISF